jgi:hypothetical protein
LPIAIYSGHCLLLPATFERCVPSDMKIKGTCVSSTLSIVQMLICTLLSWSTSPYRCLPQQVCCVHFGIEAFG